MTPTPLRPTNRHKFLKLLGLSSLSILLARCGLKPEPTPAPLPTSMAGRSPTASLYRDKPEHNHRSTFHESTIFDTRLPRVVVDLNLARPVHLAIIDGIMTAEGGAGPWDKGLSQVKPGLLVASKDPVAADAVATALMGFDPSATSQTRPFTHADNHLALASAAGLGTHQLAEIGIHGPAIRDVAMAFKPAN